MTAFLKRCAAVDEKILDDFCRSSKLADFKRPRQYLFAEAIAKSPLGKILRRMLIAGEHDRDSRP